RRLERVVEDRNDLLLHERPEVDEDVAATDEIQLREGRILRDVTARGDTAVPYRLRDLIAAVRLDEESAQPVGRYVGRDAIAIDPGTRRLDGGLADVTGGGL